jgi:hypothetical protein
METLIIQVKNKKEARKLMEISDRDVRSHDQILKWLVDAAPKDVPLTDEDIMREIRAVRINQ